MPNLYFCNSSAKVDYSRWLISTFLWNVHVHKILRLSLGNSPTFICYHIMIIFFKPTMKKIPLKHRYQHREKCLPIVCHLGCLSQRKMSSIKKKKKVQLERRGSSASEFGAHHQPGKFISLWAVYTEQNTHTQPSPR